MQLDSAMAKAMHLEEQLKVAKHETDDWKSYYYELKDWKARDRRQEYTPEDSDNDDN